MGIIFVFDMLKIHFVLRHFDSVNYLTKIKNTIFMNSVVGIWIALAFWQFVVLPEESPTDSEDDNDRQEAAEEETEEEDNNFFDTRDFLSSSSFKSSESEFQRSSFDSDEEDSYSFRYENGMDATMKSAGFNFPFVKRRNKLPEPLEKEKGVSLWSLIKDNIGKDLTKVCLPVYFNEPISSLQKCFEDLEYSFLLDRAYEWGRKVSFVSFIFGYLCLIFQVTCLTENDCLFISPQSWFGYCKMEVFY